MLQNPPSSSLLLQRNQGATRRPVLPARARPVPASAPVLRPTPATGQLALPFFQAGPRPG